MSEALFHTPPKIAAGDTIEVLYLPEREWRRVALLSVSACHDRVGCLFIQFLDARGNRDARTGHAEGGYPFRAIAPRVGTSNGGETR
jgi:hypothetical protein